MERLSYVRQLFMSKTKLEFRLLWNKIFQKEDEELGWLLNPYRQRNGTNDATMMSSFNKNDCENSYQYSYDSSTLGRERVTIHNRGVARKSDSRRRKRHREDSKTFGDKALDYARYMGLGVYITSTSFPSPFAPMNDCAIYGEQNYYYQPSSFPNSKLW